VALAIAAVGELDFGMIVLSFPRERNMKHTQHDEHLRYRSRPMSRHGTWHGTAHGTAHVTARHARDGLSRGFCGGVLPSAVPAGCAPGLPGSSPCGAVPCRARAPQRSRLFAALRHPFIACRTLCV
jgi:hypothetical protein